MARQLRLRDVGGLIVIDFIDMSSTENQKTVENTMRNALQPDRARVQIGRISQFGLMQMSRQRLRPSLEELTTEVCPRCSGQGRIQDVKSLALAILRIVEEESLKERSTKIRALVPLNVAAFLLNEKRAEVADIERRTQTHIVIVPNVNMETPQYEVQRIRDDHEVDDLNVPSYELTDSATALADEPTASDAPGPREQPAVQAVRPPKPAAKAPAPEKPSAKKTGLISRMMSSLFSDGAASATKKAAEDQGKPSAKPAPQRKDRKRAKDGDSDRKNAKGNGSKRGGKGGKSSAKDAKPKGDGRQNERKAKPKGGDRKGQGRQRQRKKEEAQPAANPVEEQAARAPDEEALAQSKRRPRRNRGKIAEEARQETRQGDGGQKRSEPAAAEAPATDQAATAPEPPPQAMEPPQPAAQPSRAEKDPEPSPAPVKAASPEPASDGASNEADSSDSSPKPAPSRALNDPRVRRRQQQEAALKAAD